MVSPRESGPPVQMEARKHRKPFARDLFKFTRCFLQSLLTFLFRQGSRWQGSEEECPAKKLLSLSLYKMSLSSPVAATEPTIFKLVVKWGHCMKVRKRVSSRLRGAGAGRRHPTLPMGTSLRSSSTLRHEGSGLHTFLYEDLDTVLWIVSRCFLGTSQDFLLCVFPCQSVSHKLLAKAHQEAALLTIAPGGCHSISCEESETCHSLTKMLFKDSPI